MATVDNLQIGKEVRLLVCTLGLKVTAADSCSTDIDVMESVTNPCEEPTARKNGCNHHEVIGMARRYPGIICDKHVTGGDRIGWKGLEQELDNQIDRARVCQSITAEENVFTRACHNRAVEIPSVHDNGRA